MNILKLAIRAAPALGLLFLAAHASGAESIGPICNEGTETPPLVLRWAELPNAGSVATLAAPVVHLIVTNNTARSFSVRVLVAGALDEVRETLDAGEITVKAHGTMTLPVNLAGFAHGLGSLRFSGRLVAKGFARLQRAGPVTDVAYSPHAFVHPEGTRLKAYRTDALVQSYGAGDFAGRAVPLRRWAAARGLRLAGVGSLGRGLALSDDDGGPQEGPRQ